MEGEFLHNDRRLSNGITCNYFAKLRIYQGVGIVAQWVKLLFEMLALHISALLQTAAGLPLIQLPADDS